MAGLALEDLMTPRYPSVTTFRGLWRTGFIIHESWRVHSMPRATQQDLRETERERERAETWGSAFIGVEDKVPKIWGIHFKNLTCKSRN